MGRPKLFDRANQPQIRFRTEEKMYEELREYAIKNKITFQQLFEKLALDFYENTVKKDR